MSRKANYFLRLSVFFQPDSGIACTEGHVCTHPKGDTFGHVTEDDLKRKCLKDAECKAIEYEKYGKAGHLCNSTSTISTDERGRRPNEFVNPFHVVTKKWKACVFIGL